MCAVIGVKVGAYGCRMWCGACPERRQVKQKASCLIEVAVQSEFQNKVSYTMVVRSLLDGVLVVFLLWLLRLQRPGPAGG